MPDFLYDDIYYEGDGELNEAIYPHRDEGRGKPGDIRDRFSGKINLFISPHLEANNIREDRIDLLLQYRIEEINDEDTKENFFLIFEDIKDIQKDISNEDLLAIKKWIINASNDDLCEIFYDQNSIRLGEYYALTNDESYELLLYILDEINGNNDTLTIFDSE